MQRQVNRRDALQCVLKLMCSGYIGNSSSNSVADRKTLTLAIQSRLLRRRIRSCSVHECVCVCVFLFQDTIHTTATSFFPSSLSSFLYFFFFFARRRVKMRRSRSLSFEKDEKKKKECQYKHGRKARKRQLLRDARQSDD